MEVEVGKDTTRASHFAVSCGTQARSQALQTSAWPLIFFEFLTKNQHNSDFKAHGSAFEKKA